MYGFHLGSSRVNRGQLTRVRGQYLGDISIGLDPIENLGRKIIPAQLT